jgi:uncharacterized Zn-binding protein involved in type VI secretion
MPAMIVLGDKTDHGGEVIEASGVTDTHGKRIARVGDKVYCPKKGHGTTEIVTGDTTMIMDGKAVAYHGCKTSCGATLISSQMLATVEFGGGSSERESTSETAAAIVGAVTTPSPASALFDLRFLLKDDKTGQPIAGMPYRITLDSGEQFSGRTDADGMTQTVGSDTQRVANIEAPFYGDLTSSSHTHDEHCPCCC